MSYPVGWDLVNITGTYVGRNGVPCVGSVTLSSPQLVLRSGTIVPAADIVFDLVNGTFSGQIPATDDPNANPSGWTYTVTENVPGGRQGYQIVAPHTSPGIDLSTVVPVTMPMPPTFGFPYVTLAQLAGTSVGDGAYLIGYQNTFTGSVARTVQDRLLDVVSVLDAMTPAQIADVRAKTFTQDVTAVINTVIANNPGKSIHFPSGGYLVSGPIIITSGSTSLFGDSYTGTIIKTSSATSDIIQINCGSAILSYISVRDFILDATSVKTGGYGISITASSGGTCYWTTLSNIVTSNNMYGGVFVQSCFYLNLNDITIEKVAAGGHGFSFIGVNASTQVANVYGRNLKVAAGVSSGATYGMFIDNYCQGMYFSQVSLESNGLDVDLYLNNASGVHANAPMNLWFNQLICDSSNNNGILISDCVTVRFASSWTTSCKNSGVYVSAGVDIEFTSHAAINNGADGYTIHGGTQIKIIGGICDANSANASNTNAGVNVAANVTDFTVRDVDFLRTGSSARHYADIYVAAGSSDRYVLSGNRCRGGVTYSIFDGGTGVNKWIQQNDVFNPRGASVTQPAVPASGTAAFNATGQDCMVYISGGTVSNIAVDATLTGITSTNSSFMVPAGGSIQVFYTSAPTWKWFGN